MALSSTMQLLVVAAYIVFLYYVTAPGVFINLPSANDSKMIQTLTHGVVFAAIFVLTQDMVVKMISKY
jgi:hypothetical protein